MCGIAGIVRVDGSPVEAGELDAVTDALAHRGPDGRGTFIVGNAGLGHRRLSIIDLSTASSQPMRSEDGNVILSFNGEIYDFQKSRAALEARGHRFTSSGDTEVLLHLYLEYGEDCVDHLRGQFAFAVLDLRKRCVFLARDRVGKKPISYFLNDGVFAFASELKALRTHPVCPRGVDREAIHHYLTLMYLPSPMTGITGIHSLPAGHAMTVKLDGGEPEIRRYWKLSYAPDRSVSVGEWKERIRAGFEESVKLRMIADVPVGAFLSGGIDSAAVVAFMAKQSSRPVRTFSIGSDDPRYDELPQAQQIADAFHTEHHPIPLDADIVHLLPALVAAYEEPYADPSAIPTFLVSRETRKSVTVALNGDGGDENFAGYVRYPILEFSEKWHRLPGAVHALAHAGTRLLHALKRDTFSYRADRFQQTIGLPWERRYLQYISFFTDEEKRALYAPGFAADFPLTDAWFAERTSEARSRGDTVLHKAMLMDFETYLADCLLPKVDLGSMAHSLEARSPFLDHKFLEMTAQIPSEYKLRGRVKKWILKEALAGIIPDETLHRPKRGFRLPLDRWFRGPLKEFVRGRLLDGGHAAFYEMIDRAALEKFLNDYAGSRVNMSDHVWALLWLEEWIRQYGL